MIQTAASTEKSRFQAQPGEKKCQRQKDERREKGRRRSAKKDTVRRAWNAQANVVQKIELA